MEELSKFTYPYWVLWFDNSYGISSLQGEAFKDVERAKQTAEEKLKMGMGKCWVVQTVGEVCAHPDWKW